MKTIYTILICVLTFTLFLSAQNGWEKLRGPYGWQVNNIAAGNSVVIAGTPQGFYSSADDGLSWSEANNGFWGADVSAICYLNGFFFAGVWDGTGSGILFFSDDNGGSWAQINTINLAGVSITSFCRNDNYIFAGTSGNKIFRSSDNGIHWTLTNYNLQPVVSVKSIGSNLFAGTSGGGVYVTTDNGDTWSALERPGGRFYVSSLTVFNGDLIASFEEIVYKYSLASSQWTVLFNAGALSDVYVLETNGSNIYLGTYQGLYLSGDGGANWDNLGLNTADIYSAGFSNGNIIAGCRDIGIIISTDNGSSWLATGVISNTMVEAIGIDGDNLFVGNDAQPGVFISRNSGNGFVDYNNLAHSFANCFHFTNSNVYAGASPNIPGAGGVFKSTDSGHTWTQIGLANKYVNNIIENSSYLFAGTSEGIFRTSTDGAIWQQVNTGLTDLVINKAVTVDSILYAGTNSGMFRSTDNGTSWSTFGLEDIPVISLASMGSELFAGTLNGIFITTENNPVWQQSAFQDTLIRRLANTTSKLFAMTSSDLFYSDNYGNSWIQIREDGLSNAEFNSLAVNDSLIFLGTWGDGLWKSYLSDVITNTAESGNSIVKDFKLYQNYPNPFNPSTKIKYSVPESQSVKILLYDILGRELRTIINEYKRAGTYEVEFNADVLPSGVYFYRILSESYSDTKKMLLLR